MDIDIHYSSSKGNLYRVSDGKTSLLIEAGVPIAKIKESLDYKVSEIAGCLISHSHKDHSHGVKDLMKMGINCYMSPETAKELGLQQHHRIQLFWETGEQKRIGSWTVKGFPLVHDVKNLGFLLVSGRDKLLFAVDTSYIPYRFKGLSHVMLGVNFDNDILMDNITCGHIDPVLGKRILRNHMSFRTARGFFQANDMSKVREIYLLHLSDANSDAEKFKRETEGLTGKPVYI